MKLSFSVNKIVAIIQTNREQHLETYQEVTKNFQELLVEETERLYKAAFEYSEGGRDWESYRRLTMKVLSMQKPVHYLEDYDRAIAMLQMTECELIELDQEDYARFVLDDWKWKENFTASNATYLA